MMNCELCINVACVLCALFHDKFDRLNISFYWFRSFFPRSDASHHILFPYSICIFISEDSTKNASLHSRLTFSISVKLAISELWRIVSELPIVVMQKLGTIFQNRLCALELHRFYRFFAIIIIFSPNIF